MTNKVCLRILALCAMVVFFIGCGEPSPQPPQSPLDGRLLTPGSMHCGHVRGTGSFDYWLDDGTMVTFFFTGGTDPSRAPTTAGVLCVSVPSYYSDGISDDDGTYYFRSFKPDAEALR